MSDFSYSVAPVWRRLLALVYDSFILVALSMLYGAITIVIFVAIYGKGEQDYAPMMGGWLFRAGWFFTLVGFYIFFWYRASQTVGMRAWRLTLVDQNGLKPSLLMCTVRALVSPFTFALLGIGYFWAAIDKNRDCLQDKLSHTRVIYTPKK